jgi:tetratricopeptide (TPR) repeat protein
MAQWRLLKNSITKRCELMWNFLNEIPEWLAQRVSAWIGREAQADAMYRGSSPSRNTHQADRSARAIHPLFICLIGIGTLQPTIVVFAAGRCPAANATKVVSVQGNVTWSAVSNATLNAAKFNDLLCVGDTVRVGAKSRAVLRLSNETTIPLDQNTIFQLKEAISEKEPTLIDLLQGAIHIITRTPKPFKVNTPYLNAVVEGTEFYVGVDNEEGRVAVIEGKVNVSNEQGAVLLTDNEAATAKKGQAPQKTLTIKPRDAVQWALYYPPLFDPRSRSGGQNLSASHVLYSQGKITDAIESLDAIPEAERNGDYYSYRAGLLLLVGRADEAEPDIETALRENGNNTDALSLKAIIAIVKNDKAKALELANQAVNIDDKSAQARIALSYALQANFKIEDALKQARVATERDPNNALAWARVAELELSIPNYDKSKEAAEKAVALNPNLARTQSVLGFANLTRIDIKEAKESFNKAITLDQSDPLPRLGLGLVTIREGNLEQGREQIEIAASLDPENSLIRSYLGKAYYEEKRDDKAAKQFALAKERDPKDPTPYFYDAIRKQTENYPVDGLYDVETSIELNNNRAVYRSKSLLERDIPARNNDLGAIYGDLAFGQLKLNNAYQLLNADFGNYAAHLMIADGYLTQTGRESARVSELLQAQLLDQEHTISLGPQFFETNSVSPQSFSNASASLNEYSSMFFRDGGGLKATGVLGSYGTRSGELLFSGRKERFSLSLGQYYYETDGFRPNSDLIQKDFRGLIQFKPFPQTNIQFEAGGSSKEQGDRRFLARLDFNPFSESLSQSDISRNTRIGFSHTFQNDSKLIGSAYQRELDFRQSQVRSGPFGDATEALGAQEEAKLIELQYVGHAGSWDHVFGLSSLNSKFDLDIDVGPGIFSTKSQIDIEHDKFYAYSRKNWKDRAWLNVGISADAYVEQSQISRHNVYPKIGLTYAISPRNTVRFAYFSALKSTLGSSQRLEPTTIGGFNQTFDDLRGTKSDNYGVAYDFRLSSEAYGGFEFVERRLNVPYEFFDFTGSPVTLTTNWKARTTRGYFYFAPAKAVALSVEGYLEKLNFNSQLTGNNFLTSLRTFRVPVTFSVFPWQGFSWKFKATYVRQNGSYLPDLSSPTIAHDTSFWIVDTYMEYRIPRTRGSIQFGITNLFDKDFNVQQETDPNERTVNLSQQLFETQRKIFGKIVWNF